LSASQRHRTYLGIALLSIAIDVWMPVYGSEHCGAEFSDSDHNSADVAYRLVNLVYRRLMLMENVARWKWNTKTPLTDRVREEALLRELSRSGTGKGVPSELTRTFFAAQFEAGKRIQGALFIKWKAAEQGYFFGVPDLALVQRSEIDAVSQEMLDSLAALHKQFQNPFFRASVAAAIEKYSNEFITIDTGSMYAALQPIFFK
jgi:chorismate mutase-like protein